MKTGELKGAPVRHDFHGEFRWAFLPYCLDRQEDGRWVILNRDYKPLGMLTRDFVRYEDHAVAAYLGGLTAAVRQRLEDRDNSPDRIYLYDDGSVPTSSKEAWAKYSSKLEALAKLTVSTEPITKADKDEQFKRELRAKHIGDAVRWTGGTEAEAEERFRRGDRLTTESGVVEWKAGRPSKYWRD